MRTLPLSVGFMPLVDAAPLIVAHELGFAEEEGLALNLQSAPSWSTLRDRLVLGQIEAAHMLAPVPVAMALGLGGVKTRLDALSVMSVNGNVFGVSNALAAQLRDQGHGFDFNNAQAAGQALIATGKRLRIGVPFPFSMHAELVYYWLSALGLPAPQGVRIRTVPPPLMADAVRAGEIDAFCVGEPWGSMAVETGHGALLLPGSAIWEFSPEKVLTVRSEWAEAEPELLGRLMRAVWQAGRWLAPEGRKAAAAEILSRKPYLDVPAEVIDRALTGRLTISERGDLRHVPGFVRFHNGAANFPWRSQAKWIAGRLAPRVGLDPEEAQRRAAPVFRSDLYRRELKPIGAEMPGASEKLEGAIRYPTAVASTSGRLTLMPDAFFDGLVFDPVNG